MPFVNALFLIGTAAAAIPLVLHLIHTTRAPQAPFPTLRFLRLAAEKTARRRRVQNLFLLLLRMALFALLALALARPFVSPDLAVFGAAKPRAAIILDNSMSQGVTYGGRSRLEHLKVEAEALLKSDLGPSEVLLLVADGPQSRDNPPGRPAAILRSGHELIQRIRQVEVGSRRAELAHLLAAAYQGLDAGDAAERRIYIFTDLQARSWTGVDQLNAVPEHPNVPVCVIHADNPGASNVAVTDVRATGADRVVAFPVPIEVTLWSTPDLKGQRALSLYVDDMNRPRERLPVTMPIERGKNDRLTFRPTFLTAGRHRLRVEIEADDSLPLDNARRLALDIQGDIRVVIACDPRGLTGVDNPAFYLQEALARPDADTTAWAIQTDVAAPSDLSDQILADADVLILADVAAMPDDLRRRLQAFVRRGKTLMVFPGPATVPARWNLPAADHDAPDPPLLPARLAAVKSQQDPSEGPVKIIQVATGDPTLAGLADLRYWQRVVVSSYVLLAPEPAAETLLQLNTGDPLLVAATAGRGRVYLFAVPATGDWSNLQRTNIFLPLVLRLIHRAVQREHWPSQIVSGDILAIDYALETDQTFNLLVADPEHPATPRQKEPDPGTSHLFTINDTFALGFYELAPATTPPSPRLQWTFAVNPDGLESDLTPLSPDQLRARLPARELYLATSIADLQAQLKSLGRQELWQHFLLAVLLLTLFECLMSNRLRPRREAKGVLTLVDRLLGRSQAPGKPQESDSP